MSLLDAVRRTFEPPAITTARAAAVPAPIADKLRHLAELADVAGAAARDVAERLRDAVDEQRTCEGLLARARADAARHPSRRHEAQVQPLRQPNDFVIERVLAGDHSSEVPALEQRHALAVREVERLTGRAQAARERAQAAGRVAERCADWVKGTEPAVLAEAVTRMRREAGAIALPRDPARLPAELASVRESLRAFADERAVIERAPVPLAEARERAVAILDGLTANWQWNVTRFFSATYDSRHEDGAELVPPSDSVDFRPFVAVLLGGDVKAAMLAALEREAQRHEITLTGAERAKRLAAVDAKARVAGVREELLVQALEATGLEAPRREDGEPMIVVCVADDSGAAAA